MTDLLGEAALDKLIEHRTQQTLKDYQARLSGCSTLLDKLQAIATMRSEEGYMAEIQELDGDYLLIEHHCPICIAAKTCQGFCRSELEVFTTLLAQQAEVKREEHVVTGARRCTYRIKPKA